MGDSSYELKKCFARICAWRGSIDLRDERMAGMKMFLISDNVDTYTGLRLAGVEGVVVHGETALRAELERAVQDAGIGIVLLTEKFGRIIRRWSIR